jgi:hypothetical protein
MTDSAHSMNLRGARLGVSFTQGDEAMSMLNRRNLAATASLEAMAGVIALTYQRKLQGGDLSLTRLTAGSPQLTDIT